jgi:CMP-N-acetylneuraminic acid synthetase
LEVLAIVPARGGSKKLPRKNLRVVQGSTLVARAVDCARAARRVTRIVGSTDDPEIAAELRRAGAEVPFFRPVELAGDDVPDSPVFLHVVDALATEGYEPAIVVNVRPTAPLRTGTDIDSAIGLLEATPSCRSVKSVSRVAEHPYKMWTLTGSGQMEPLLPDWVARQGGDVDAPRQSLPEVYRSNGVVDAVWVAALRATGQFHPGPVAGFLMDAERSLDIDTFEDLLTAIRRLGGDAI